MRDNRVYSVQSLTPSENLPDPGKAQDFMKKFNQALGEDEKLRLQLDQLISPTCSCKQAEQCVVSLIIITSSSSVTFSTELKAYIKILLKCFRSHC